MAVVFDSTDLEAVSAFVRAGYSAARWSPVGDRDLVAAQLGQLLGVAPRIRRRAW